MTKQFDHCDPNWANDYASSHHLKACLSAKWLSQLWLSGHCHNVNNTLPLVGKEGLLFCSSEQYLNSDACCSSGGCTTGEFCAWDGTLYTDVKGWMGPQCMDILGFDISTGSGGCSFFPVQRRKSWWC